MDNSFFVIEQLYCARLCLFAEAVSKTKNPALMELIF